MAKTNSVNTTIQATPALSDTQRQLIVAALTHPAAGLVLLERLKGNAAAKTADALVGKGLVRELRTKADLPVWRQEPDTGKRFSLVLTKAGRSAATALADAARPEQASTTPTPISRAARASVAPQAQPAAVLEVKTANAGSPDADTGTPRLGSKLAGVIALLRRDTGSSVSEMMAATGWLPHTTRAVLTGLRKRGFTLSREAAEGGSVYRITEDAASAAAA